MGYNIHYDKLNSFYLLLSEMLEQVEPLLDEDRWLRNAVPLPEAEVESLLKKAREEVYAERLLDESLRNKAKVDYEHCRTLIAKYKEWKVRNPLTSEQLHGREQLWREIAKTKADIRDKALRFARQIV